MDEGSRCRKDQRYLTEEYEVADGQVLGTDVLTSDHGHCNETAEIEELVEEIQDFNNESSDLTQDDFNEHHNVFINDDSRNISVKHAIIIIFDKSKFGTPVGLVKILILASCIVGLTCICTTDYAALTLASYIRFQIFSLSFTFLAVLVVFLIEILNILRIFPVHWPHLNVIVHLVVCFLLNASSLQLLHAVFSSESTLPRLDSTAEVLIVCGVSGHFGALLCTILSIIACCCYDHHLMLPWNRHNQGVLMLK